VVVFCSGLLTLSLAYASGEASDSAAALSGADLPPGTHGSTADHTKFEILQQPFRTGPEVTAACLTCHTEAAKQIMQTSHWTWICPRAGKEVAAKQHRQAGKGGHLVNNFSISIASNEPRCTSCHAGYGWKDKTFDFDDQTLVDCLVCHDTTRTYKKFPTKAGHPVYADDPPEKREWPPGSGNLWEPPDLSYVARNIGKSDRHTCGMCHFWGGGGEGAKHGDMDTTLAEPDRELDVHMHAGGLNFTCTACHTTREHKIAGRCFTIPAFEEHEFVMRGLDRQRNFLACESCHTTAPHDDSKLDDHADKVSCQACHIPTFARRRPTKMWWDWSRAGEKDERGQLLVRNEEVKGSTVVSYHTMQGQSIWAKDEVPEYRWFNGSVTFALLGDKIDDETPASERGILKGLHDQLDLSQPVVLINSLQGNYHDPKSRIQPVKVHRGKQPYDKVNKTFVVPKLFGPAGSGAFWAEYDWNKSIAAGMEYVERPYSGELGWIQTEMSWPLSHMVAPKEQAVSCVECHRPAGRLANLTGFYMPGRDRSRVLDGFGLLIVLGSAVAVVLHGGLRGFIAWKGRHR